jgi:hypothetical protein
MNNDKYIGLDVYQSSIVTGMHNHQGKCVMESNIGTKAQTNRKKGANPFYLILNKVRHTADTSSIN